MEDPWANAWGDSSKSVLPAPSPAWAAPSVSALHGDHEDDLSNPAWPKETSSRWSGNIHEDAGIWGGTEPSFSSSSAWNPEPSTFDKISLGGESVVDIRATTHTSQPDEVANRSITPSQSSSVDEVESELESLPKHQPLTPPPAVLPPISIPAIDEGDGFGSFATASTEEDPGWNPTKPSFQPVSADTAAWGGGWGEPVSASVQDDSDDSDADAWEVARRQKELQDRHVPPELLTSILEKAEELSTALWGDAESTKDELDSTLRVESESLGIEFATQTLAPDDLVLPMNGAFSKTVLHQQLSEALKLTRHSKVSRASPFAMYMASKGSISWEASIKARAALAPEDITPAGWRIIEQLPVEQAVEEKKKAGGFFSFFGRKTQTASIDSARRPASPASISAVPSIKSTVSPRISIDSTRSSVVASNPFQSMASSPVVVAPEDNLFGSQNSELVSAAASDLPDTSIDGLDEPAPPTAVSRFLDRFSGRNRRSTSKDSLALSTDDIEFLSDVPTAASTNGEDGPDLDALSLMLNAPTPSIPTILPLPLPPPPKAAPLPILQPPPQFSPSSVALIKPVTATMTPPPVPKPVTISHEDDDFMDFFDQKPAITAVSQHSKLSSGDPLSFFDSQPVQPASRPPPATEMPIPQPNSAPLHTGITDDDDDWAPFDHPAPQAPTPVRPFSRPPSTKPVATPPPTQNKRSFVPIMNNSRSSTPVNSRTSNGFSLPPPPSFTSSRPPANVASVGPTPITAPLAPPSIPRPPSKPLPDFGSLKLAPLPSSQSAPTTIQPADDDDFADFLSSPPAADNQVKALSFGDFAGVGAAASTTPVMNPPMVSKNSSLDFSFLDPPAASSVTASRKTSLTAINVGTKPSLPSTKTQPNHVRKVSREADHARTQSLLDSAVARGRWLAPPSPIPEALAPPPSSSDPIDNLLDGGSKMQFQQARAVASITPKSTGPTLLPPPAWKFPGPPSKSMGATTLQAAPSQQTLFKPTSPPRSQPFLQPAPSFKPTSKPIATPPQNATGGLSAQDLSFFEGL